MRLPPCHRTRHRALLALAVPLLPEGVPHYTGVCIGTATIWCERMPDYRRGGHRQASNAPLLGHGGFPPDPVP